MHRSRYTRAEVAAWGLTVNPHLPSVLVAVAAAGVGHAVVLPQACPQCSG
jgi:hypothetical protein